MGGNVSIEVDKHTADVLQTRAAELGVTVPQLIAELATLDSARGKRTPTRSQSSIADLRRASEARQCHTGVWCGGCALGHAPVPTVAGPIEIEWSLDALADLDRFAAFLHRQFPELRRARRQ